eukprot:snap_masked-scaffold_34-processed-gene-0.39-mRNA-1 protein AED:1.00 eAED:1.00 QI:0/0/0/0/1/1/2/0/120
MYYQQIPDENLLNLDFTAAMGADWIKTTDKAKPFSSMGHWLRHRKELCFVGKEGNFDDDWLRQKESDFITEKVGIPIGNLKKIYQLIETCLPGGFNLALFGRGGNIRNSWLIVGNEVPQT